MSNYSTSSSSTKSSSSSSSSSSQYDIIDLTSDNDDDDNNNNRKRKHNNDDLILIKRPMYQYNDDNNDTTSINDNINEKTNEKINEYSVRIDHHKNCFGIPCLCNCLGQAFIFAHCYHNGLEMIPIRSGKWLLFPTRDHVNEVWSKVVELLGHGRLGNTAKVSVNQENENERHLICIYTYDHEDIVDVFRVLLAIRENFQAYNSCILNYKTDSATQSGTYADEKSASVAGFEMNKKRSNDELVCMYQSPKLKENERSYLVRNNVKVGERNKRYIVAKQVNESDVTYYPDFSIEYTTKSGSKR